MSLSAIGRQFGVTGVTVMNMLKRAGIERRDPGTALRTNLAETTIGDWFVTKDKRWDGGKHLRWRCVCGLCDESYWVLARSLYDGTSTKCQQCQRRLHRKGFASLNGTHWSIIQKAAAERGLNVDITIEQAWNLFQRQNGICALSGLPIAFGYKTAGTASLDRIDSNKGYVEGNVQWVHKDINRMKWKHEEDYFVNLCRAVANHQNLHGRLVGGDAKPEGLVPDDGLEAVEMGGGGP